MRHDVHAAALGAATRVAFSILLVGCGGGTTTETALGDPGDPSQAQTGYGESDLRTGAPPCHADAGADADAAATDKPSCDELLAASFPDAGAWPGADGQNASTDVKACCNEALVKDGAATRYRWSCCNAIGWGTGTPTDAAIGAACTPWGPPVPPAMSAAKAVA
jgi:hypothetical protein